MPITSVDAVETLGHCPLRKPATTTVAVLEALRDFFDFLNQGNLPSEEFLDSGFVYHDPGVQDVNDLASVRQWVAASHDAFPDQHSTIEGLVAEGDRVVCRYSLRATHQRDFRGIPATGKQTTVTAVAIYRIVGGKIQEEWHYSHVEA